MMKKNNKEDEKIIPKKNYVILLILFLVTFLLVFYLYKWYVVYSDYQNSIPIISDTLSEITEEEMEHYISDNSTATIYVCTASDTVCRNFEKNFKKLINQSSLKEYIAYVRLNDENKDEFITRFNQNHSFKKASLNKYPALIFFEDGEISDILQESEKEKLTISDVKQFIKRNKIGSYY